jgi:hypothetical protein
MANLLIRNVDRRLLRELSRRARTHGRSLSEEAACVLAKALPTSQRLPEHPKNVPERPEKLGTWLFNLLPEEYRGDDLVFETPWEIRKPPEFD